jgi:hypothetical protein
VNTNQEETKEAASEMAQPLFFFTAGSRLF